MSYWTDKWENHKTENDLKKHKEKKILLILLLVIFIAILGVLAYLATKNRWFEKGSRSGNGQQDSSRSSVAPVFPSAVFAEDEESLSTVEYFPRDIPDYSGFDTVIISDVLDERLP